MRRDGGTCSRYVSECSHQWAPNAQNVSCGARSGNSHFGFPPLPTMVRSYLSSSSIEPLILPLCSRK